MKKSFQNSILILAFASIMTDAALLSKSEAKVDPRFLADIGKSITDIKEKRTEEFIKQIEIKKDCKDEPVVKAIICYEGDEKKATINMKSPLQHFELIIENLDISSGDSADINVEKYFNEFFDSLKDLANTQEDINNSIRAGIEDGLQKNKYAEVVVKVENDASAKDGCNFSFKAGDQTNVVNCKIEAKKVTFMTDFITDTIELSIPDKRFIKFEISKIVRETSQHLVRVKKFTLSEGASEGQSTKITSCDSISNEVKLEKELTTRVTDAGLKMDISTKSIKISSTQNANEFIQIKCEDLNVGSFAIIQLEMDFKNFNPSIESRKQPLLAESLYDMKIVGISFIADSITLAIQLMSPNNKEMNYLAEEVSASTQQSIVNANGEVQQKTEEAEKVVEEAEKVVEQAEEEVVAKDGEVKPEEEVQERNLINSSERIRGNEKPSIVKKIKTEN